MQSLLASLRMKGLGGDLLISLAAQALAALLGLLLVKLSVTLYSASAYGLASLVLGLQSLLRNILLQPFLQYFILHYWDHARPEALGRQVRRAVDAISLGTLPLILIAAMGIGLPLREALIATAFIGLMAVMEGRKSIRLLPLNLHQAQKRYGAYLLVDAMAKPLCVLLAAQLFGAAPLGLVLAHLAGGSLVFLLIPLDGRLASYRRVEEGPSLPPLRQSLGFLWPIALVGVAGWITGLSDRYVVARALGLEAAGHYAALYGLFAAPFLIYATGVNNVVRPKLQLGLMGPEGARHRRHFLWGFLGFLAGALLLALLLYLAHRPLLGALLRAEYRPALPALPGILLGQVCMAAGLYLELDFYVRKRTRWVMAKQLAGALAGLVAIPLCILWKGMAGAGLACTLYFGVDLAVGLWLAWRGGDPAQGSGSR